MSYDFTFLELIIKLNLQVDPRMEASYQKQEEGKKKF